ncbi:MAG: helix-turn-helix transcriptional regulator [Clostridia bacterium]|nr:helix-turn-helix transcriptional regulator [Clostridia bacterium]
MIIKRIGYQYIHRKDFAINRPNGEGDYLLLLVRSSAYFMVNGERQQTKSQSFIIFDKGSAQHYGAVEERYVNDWAYFDMDKEERAWLQGLGIPFDAPLFCGDITDCSQLIKTMYHERFSVNQHKEEALELYFRLLLIKIAEKLNDYTPQRKYPHYEKIRAVHVKIYEMPKFAWTIEEMAKEAMLSESYFHRLYKEILGHSPMEDVIISRIEYGKYLLHNTDYAVSRVAEECGYHNDVHFMRQFKEITGSTPSQYRKRIMFSRKM